MLINIKHTNRDNFTQFNRELLERFVREDIFNIFLNENKKISKLNF
jgi:hypothetical protein